MAEDIRKSHFMQMNFSEDELERLHGWIEASGRVAAITGDAENGFNAWHVDDKEKEIDLVFMKERAQAANWLLRMGFREYAAEEEAARLEGRGT